MDELEGRAYGLFIARRRAGTYTVGAHSPEVVRSRPDGVLKTDVPHDRGKWEVVRIHMLARIVYHRNPQGSQVAGLSRVWGWHWLKPPRLGGPWRQAGVITARMPVFGAAAPAGASQPPFPAGTCMDIGAVAASSAIGTRKRKARGSRNHVTRDAHKRQRKAALLLTAHTNTGAST